MRVDSDGRRFFYNQLSSLLPDKDQVQEVTFLGLRLVAAAAVAASTYRSVMSNPRGRLEALGFAGLIQGLKFACLAEEKQSSFAVQVVRWNQALLSGVAIGAASASLVMGAHHLEAAKLDCKITTVCKAVFDIAWAIGDPGVSSWHLFSKSMASDKELLQDLRVPAISLTKVLENVLSSYPHFFSGVLVQPLEKEDREDLASLLSRIDRVVDFSLFAFLSSAQLYYHPKPILCGLLMGTISLYLKDRNKSFNLESSNEPEEANQVIKPDLKFFSGSFPEYMRSIATKFLPITSVDTLSWLGGISAGKGMASDFAQYWNGRQS